MVILELSFVFTHVVNVANEKRHLTAHGRFKAAFRHVQPNLVPNEVLKVDERRVLHGQGKQGLGERTPPNGVPKKVNNENEKAQQWQSS